MTLAITILGTLSFFVGIMFAVYLLTFHFDDDE